MIDSGDLEDMPGDTRRPALQLEHHGENIPAGPVKTPGSLNKNWHLLTN